jgi:citrate lyase subunit beta/citryl-CoA lyase
MPTITRPRRSVLYMPGSNARALEKARSVAADGLIFDLEDAVAPAAKEEARALVVAELKKGGYAPRETIVRVNGLDTPWGKDDLRAAASSGALAVLLPKVESAASVREAERILVVAGAPPTQSLWCMIETPRGVLGVNEIAGASPRLACLVMGTSDLVKDLRARHSLARHEVIVALGMTVLAARAHGLAALDGVHLNLEDADGLEAACRQGLEMGFDGKTLIHPKTVDVANRIFAPTPEEVERARRIIAAHAEALGDKKAVLVVEGRLVEALHVEEAKRTVALAEAIAARG